MWHPSDPLDASNAFPGLRSQGEPELVLGGDSRSLPLVDLSEETDTQSCDPYSVIEMHMFLATLVRHFKFALPNDAPEIRRWRPGFLLPVVEGEEHRGPRLPLEVTSLKDM